jgi:hypothetical protein
LKVFEAEGSQRVIPGFHNNYSFSWRINVLVLGAARYPAVATFAISRVITTEWSVALANAGARATS